jgi:hypothetical protein
VTPARIPTLLLVTVATGCVGWVALTWWTRGGHLPLPLPWTAVAGAAALAVVVVVAGLPVRRWVRGERERPLDPLLAARTVVFAKAAAYGGAALVGWYAAQGLVLLPDLVGDRRGRFVLAVLAALCSVGVAVAGLVVQRWCRVPPSDDDSPP